MRPCRRRKSYFPSSEIAGLELGEEAKIRHRQRAKSVWSLVQPAQSKEVKKVGQAAASHHRIRSAWKKAEEHLPSRVCSSGQGAQAREEMLA